MQLATLASKLRKHHAQSRSWQKTAEHFGVAKSVAHAIACRGYDPADPEIRRQLGLGPRPCPTCKRRLTVPRKVRTYRKISDLKPDELRWCLDHREVMA